MSCSTSKSTVSPTWASAEETVRLNRSFTGVASSRTNPFAEVKFDGSEDGCGAAGGARFFLAGVAGSWAVLVLRRGKQDRKKQVTIERRGAFLRSSRLL